MNDRQSTAGSRSPSHGDRLTGGRSSAGHLDDGTILHHYGGVPSMGLRIVRAFCTMPAIGDRVAEWAGEALQWAGLVAGDRAGGDRFA